MARAIFFSKDPFNFLYRQAGFKISLTTSCVNLRFETGLQSMFASFWFMKAWSCRPTTFEREGRVHEKAFDPILCHAYGAQILNLKILWQIWQEKCVIWTPPNLNSWLLPVTTLWFISWRDLMAHKLHVFPLFKSQNIMLFWATSNM